METPTVRWGIIGPGRIAQSAVIPALHHAINATPYAVASRDPKRAKRLAARMSIPKAYGDYESLLDDPEVDAVYIAVPNGLHAEWVCKAAAAGKHVLCEKSISLNLEDAKRMRGSCWSSGVHLMEAFMYRHHPQWAKVEDLVRNGHLGHIISVDARLSGHVGAEDHRWDPDLGGGALFDVTCYGINVARLVFDAEPTSVQAVADWDERGTDRSSRVIMTFPEGGHAGAWGSFEGFGGQSVHIVGTDGEIYLERPFVTHFDPVDIILRRFGSVERVQVGGANHYLHMVEYFSQAVLEDQPLDHPGEDGVANVAVCVAARWSASRSGDPIPSFKTPIPELL
ncbi:MAG: Gfo/Idh/MocA family protein [Bradymonadia bacterium]